MVLLMFCDVCHYFDIKQESPIKAHRVSFVSQSNLQKWIIGSCFQRTPQRETTLCSENSDPLLAKYSWQYSSIILYTSALQGRRNGDWKMKRWGLMCVCVCVCTPCLWDEGVWLIEWKLMKLILVYKTAFAPLCLWAACVWVGGLMISKDSKNGITFTKCKIQGLLWGGVGGLGASSTATL